MNLVELVRATNQALLETTIAGSAALVLVLLLRRHLRAAFGASVAYAAWLLVPAALVAVLLPATPSDSASIHVVYRFSVQPVITVVAGAEPGIQSAIWLCGPWLFGALAMLLHFIRQQRLFQISLGRLHVREAGVLQAEAVVGLPAVIGLLKPAIVLPADFETRYSAEQCELMLVHERAHIRHGDLQANAALFALRCMFWFNPLFHLAARAFRHDQELACDQRVIARHPTSRRAYGEAMFRTQLVTQALPLGCHWGLTHPLKERIEMLSTSSPSRARRRLGTSLIAACVLLAAAAAWATQPAAPQQSKFGSVAVPAMGQSMTPPAYPKHALGQGIGGRVELMVDINADGSVSRAVVEHAEPAGTFDAAAIASVHTWKFSPAMKDGKPVSSRVRVPITFDPNGDPDKRNTPASTTPARLTKATQANQWSSYDRMVRSLSASWQEPAKPAEDDC